jgi:hypothetical protein
MNHHQLGPRDTGVGLEILGDALIVAPVVDESELEHRRVDAMKREDILVNQPHPGRCHFSKDLLCFLESLKRIGAKGFEGHILAVPSPSPDVGGSSRCGGGFPAFLEPLK